MTTEFSTISNIIKKRRNVKAPAMNGNKIPNGEIAALLELADWAPTHAFTEPWRFVVYAEPKAFCEKHAEIYQESTAPENFKEAVYNNLLNMGNTASHIVIAYMKRGDNPNIPAFEEIAATSCGIQNMLLGATALNIAVYWGTGGAALRPAMKVFLGLEEQDQVMGILYFGYADEYPEGKRRIPLEEKIKWVE